MIIGDVAARAILDSRKQETIEVSVNKGPSASSPNGKSTGVYETPSYYKSLKFSIDFLNKWDEKIEINKFSDLAKVEKYIAKKLRLKNAREFGANSLYAFESAILKAVAKEKGKELYEIISNNKKMPYPVANIIGGGLHSSSVSERPDFQEFLAIPKKETMKKNFEVIKDIYGEIRLDLNAKDVNDEGAWLVGLTDKEAIETLGSKIKQAERKFGNEIGLGIDAASSSLFHKKMYNYKKDRLSPKEQLELMRSTALDNELIYLEDPFEQNDFSSFAKLNKAIGKKCMVVADDLTATQYGRTIRAVKAKSINAMIIKPNQNGSLLELKKIFELCRKKKIKTIMSHRSGETMDNALADYAVGFGANYIKCGAATQWREAKLNRLLEIEQRL